MIKKAATAQMLLEGIREDNEFIEISQAYLPVENGQRLLVSWIEKGREGGSVRFSYNNIPKCWSFIS